MDVTTHAQYLKLISIVVTLETVDQPIFRDILRRGARMLIATLRMTQLAHLRALGEPTTRLCFAPNRLLDFTCLDV